MRYEEAAKIRDRIQAIEKVWESQKVVSPEIGDLDVVGFYRGDGTVLFKVFFIRSGILIGSKDLSLRDIRGVPEKDLVSAFLSQFYSRDIIPPSGIITSHQPEGKMSLERWLTQAKRQEDNYHCSPVGQEKRAC